MSVIVVFDELATPQRVVNMTGPSENEGPWRASGRTDFVINPDLSLLEGLVPMRYWKHAGGLIVEYTQAEKDAQDAAEAAADDASTRVGAKDGLQGFSSNPLLMRAFADIVRDEINLLRQQWAQLQADIAAAGNSAAAIKSAIAGLPALPDRTLIQLRNAIDARIDGGTVDS